MKPLGPSALVAFGLVVGAVALGVLFQQTRSVDTARNARVTGLLGETARLNTALDAEALRLHALESADYDRLAGLQKDLRDSVEALGDPALGLRGRFALDSALDRVAAAATDKLAAVERLKSASALVRNARRYVPTAARRATADAPPEQQVAALRLVVALLDWHLTPGDDARQHLERARAEVARLAATPRGESLAVLLPHVALGVRAAADGQAALDAMAAAGLAERLKTLHRSYERAWLGAATRAELAGLGLLMAGVVLMGVLGILLHRLDREGRRAQAAWARLRDAVESIAEAFALFDADGRLRLFNRRFREAYPDLAPVLQPGLEHGEMERVLDNAGRQIAPADATAPAETAHLEHLADGRWLAARDSLTGDGGTACVRSDVTRQRETEDRLRRTVDELLESNTELERFAYVASHDLQEPTRTVVSFAQLLERHLGADLDPSGREYLDFVVRGARRMHQLVQDLLTYSRVDSGSAAHRPVDTGRLVADVLDHLATAVEEAGAGVTVDPLPPVTGDEGQLFQLFLNLIGNALKFGDPQRPLTVRVGAEERAAETVFTVADTGIGFDAAHAESIFTVFTRLHAQDRYPGTGIGLAVCRRIVESHGGRIRAESTPGAGSRFIFTLPRTGSGTGDS